MNKKIILIILALLLLAVGAFYFFVPKLNQDSNSAVMTENSDSMMENEKDLAMEDTKMEKSIKGTLADIASIGSSYTCSFDYTDDAENTNKGVVYVTQDGDRMFGEFELMTSDGALMTSNVVRDGEYNYLWSSEFNQGYKTPIVADEDTSFFGDPKNEDDETNVGFNENAEIDFDCKPWVVDSSKFTPPENIDFIDLGESMQMLNDANITGDDNCSACDLIPDASAKAQCLEALGC